MLSDLTARCVTYAVGVLATPGQFLSIHISAEGHIDGICGHDARVSRDWLLSMIEPGWPGYDPAMDWRKGKAVDPAGTSKSPLAVGARVRHVGQQYPKAVWEGSGNIALIKGPYLDGAWEYLIYHDAGFAGTGEPGAPSWWASYATVDVEEPAW
jgi:hypothetical protein